MTTTYFRGAESIRRQYISTFRGRRSKSSAPRRRQWCCSHRHSAVKSLVSLHYNSTGGSEERLQCCVSFGGQQAQMSFCSLGRLQPGANGERRRSGQYVTVSWAGSCLQQVDLRVIRCRVGRTRVLWRTPCGILFFVASVTRDIVTCARYPRPARMTVNHYRALRWRWPQEECPPQRLKL